jgi:hypothetical protein
MTDAEIRGSCGTVDVSCYCPTCATLQAENARMRKALESADKLYDTVLDYCRNAELTDRPTVDLCKALDKYKSALSPGKE